MIQIIYETIYENITFFLNKWGADGSVTPYVE